MSSLNQYIDKFKEKTPQLFKKDGTLKADYVQADNIIERMKKDEHFMYYLSGEKQVIMTAELFGVQWKIKMDSYLPGKAIVDLKTSADIAEEMKLPFVVGNIVSSDVFYNPVPDTAVVMGTVYSGTGNYNACRGRGCKIYF